MSWLKNSTLAKKGITKPEGDVLVEKIPLRLKPEEEVLAREIQRESARVWNTVMTIHRLFWLRYGIWIDEAMMKEFLKGRFEVHSQDVQAIVETYYECWERTKKLHKEGHTEWRYPWRLKRYFTPTWKVTGITAEDGYLRLSNGWKKPPLKVKLPERLKGLKIKQVQLVWRRNGYWLHIAVVKPALEKVQGDIVAAADPGEVHALTLTDGKEALVISGGHLRSLHRLRNKTLRKFQKALSRCKKGSNRWRKLLEAKYRFLNWVEAQISHVEHAITKMAVDWCVERGMKKVYIGDPQGVRKQDCGRYHNQRMHQWDFGRLRDFLGYKLNRHGIALEQIKEGSTSGTCPVCGHYTKQSGRVFRCGNCGFSGVHRDVVGASGILDLAVNGRFTEGRDLPRKVVYLRPSVLAPVAKKCRKAAAA
ncbi:putative transposase [Thermanaeromonas toyohensis ToBE]|uniref:Putative transposase n=1 Tax=Thermanaeromonas toyohensis ToBE TaxID=698762 RepID=A0A1W1W1Q2_9FIRM|nr:RNA-guided endonuclease TnpB family protein [Thermanaeromonas toyohensis]SMB99562.1 putative transposase [Thermanaeromonas toyohensis ToBE]